MKRMELKNMNDFYFIVNSQKVNILSNLEDVEKEVDALLTLNKPCSIFSVVDSKGENYRICRGIKLLNKIGYYVLEGQYNLKDGCLNE